MQDINNLCMGCMSEKGSESICTHCGYDSAAQNPVGYMPVRTVLDNRYIIGKVIDSNGEGATYLAWDQSNETSVRVREFYPDKLASRASDGVSVEVSTDNDQLFGTYIDEFLDLARGLADCQDLPNLLPVTDIFESNGTAYYVTENVKAITLREFLLRNGGLLTWDQFRPLIMPVISTLSALHSKGIIHRGISPETLLVGRDGVIRIVGFSIAAARTDHSDINAQLYPGYAALEQYGFEVKQGPWTDVYGLTATIFRVLVGNPPPEATVRVSNDRMVIPAKVVRTMPQGVLNAMAKGLAILADDRTKSMERFKSNITMQLGAAGTSKVVMPKLAQDVAAANGAQAESGDGETESNKKYVIIAIALTVLVLLVALYFVWTAVISPNLFGNNDSSSSDLPPSRISSVATSETIVEGGQTIVPNCVGKKLSEVLSDVNTALTLQFTVVEKSYSSEYARNTIYYQSIEAGSTVAEGTTIEIKISLGSSTIVVPSVKTMSLERAIITLVEAGFEIGNITVMQKDDATIEFGKVVGTDVDSGRSVAADSAIIIYQSNHDSGDSPNTSKPSSKPSSNPSSKPSSNPSSSDSSHASSASSGNDSSAGTSATNNDH